MWSIKRTFDPHGIMNPGKILLDVVAEPVNEGDDAVRPARGGRRPEGGPCLTPGPAR